ncbi:MAG: hypothetical protein QXI16_02615 [Sulfolobaceae archaeon]
MAAPVLGAILGAIGSTALSAGQGALGYGINELFGIRKHAQKQQLKQQDKLNALSFHWNKKQMDYAQQLEKDMYSYTFDMNKPENIKNLIKEAGLNPALMYGTSAGVSGTSVGTGKGAGYNTQSANASDIIQSNLALTEMGLQLAKLRSEIDVNKSVAESNRSTAKLNEAKTKTEDEQRDKFIAKLYYDGKLSFLDSLKQQLKLEGYSGKDTNLSMRIIGDKTQIYGAVYIPTDVKDSLFGREIMSAVLQSEALSNNHIANTALTNEKLKWYFTEMMSDIAMKDSQAALNKAKKLQSEWEIGEFVNWKQILQAGLEAVNTTLKLVSTAAMAGL